MYGTDLDFRVRHLNKNQVKLLLVLRLHVRKCTLYTSEDIQTPISLSKTTVTKSIIKRKQSVLCILYY